jgi:hypothetical protein
MYVMSGLPKLEDIQEKVNQRFNNLYHKTPDNPFCPYVCTFCDEFITGQDD